MFGKLFNKLPMLLGLVSKLSNREKIIFGSAIAIGLAISEVLVYRRLKVNKKEWTEETIPLD
jgi:hypothetical protein